MVVGPSSPITHVHFMDNLIPIVLYEKIDGFKFEFIQPKKTYLKKYVPFSYPKKGTVYVSIQMFPPPQS